MIFSPFLPFKYKGQRCFIVGNGPSLNLEDLNKLKNEKTFAFNRIYYIFDKTEWRPSFYITEDIKIISNSLDEINKLNLKNIFVPDIIKFDYKIDINNAIYFKETLKLWSTPIRYISLNPIYTAICIAVYATVPPQ